MTTRRGLLLLSSGALLYLGLAWAGWVPGGWRLRNWIEPHHLREARSRVIYRQARLDQFRVEVLPEGHPVVFLGSSTIERMPLERLTRPGTSLNRGVAFESAANLLARLEVGVPPEPRGFVVYVASIDHRFEGANSPEVAEAAKKVLDKINQLWPGIPVTLMALLPEVSLRPTQVAALAEVNSALKSLCGQHGIFFVDFQSTLLIQPDGSLDPQYTTDALHLNDRGYDLLMRAVIAKSGPLGATLQP